MKSPTTADMNIGLVLAQSNKHATIQQNSYNNCWRSASTQEQITNNLMSILVHGNKRLDEF